MGEIMNYEKITLKSGAILECYITQPINNRKRPALLICPGGAYLMISPNEGECVALKFLAEGFQTFVLNYTTLQNCQENCTYPKQLQEIEDAMAIIREQEKRWYVDVRNISFLGFSAGANLVAEYGCKWKMLKKQAKPANIVLCYPLLDYKLSLSKLEHQYQAAKDEYSREKIKNRLALIKKSAEILTGESDLTENVLKKISPVYNVNKDVPRTFLWHSFEDELVDVEQSLIFAQKLYMAGVPCEVHLYEKGHHGISMASAESAQKPEHISDYIHTWVTQAVKWLKQEQE